MDALRTIVIFPMKVMSKHFSYIHIVHTNFPTHHYLHTQITLQQKLMHTINI